MTKERLEIELAEAVVALQRIQILALRNCSTVSAKEVSETVAPLTKFKLLPTDVQDHIRRIREERWDIR
jgi:hypothetical protein